MTGWRRRLTRRPCARREDGPGLQHVGRAEQQPWLRSTSEAHQRPTTAERGGVYFPQLMSVWTNTQEHVVQSRILMRSATTYHYWFCVHSSGHNRAADGGLAMCLPQSFLARRHANKRSRWLQMRGSRERKLQTDKKTARGGKAIENTNTMRITECGGPSRPSLQQRAPSRCDPLT